MRKIDRETVQRILDTAQIVDVVSDFVTLKRRGANYIGLCPFHNERTPSFSVSPAKGICKCFSCGKGGSPVNFIMEMEQLTYSEALRYLAKKYHIEIREDELTPEQEQAENERASMFAVNEFAARHFAMNLTDNADGRAIGLSYFRERGINDAMVKRFQLGYALERRDDLRQAALRHGFQDKFLVETGLCVRRDDGSLYDRFKGRVIYPVHTLSGKVVAFGGRTLRTDKQVAKYVNSPESIIYKKNQQLYGLYQARQAIARADKCILVEGYMDVISMHQSGVENVVASSGTSLTEGQIRLIHRLTRNVTVVYDADAAGIKASLRGIDMLLAEGLNVKVLLLPEGDDPDSYAQNHTATETEQYFAENETDFISFKTRVLLEGARNDPMARSAVINDVVNSISVIPDPVARDEYVRTCSLIMGIDDKVLNLQVSNFMGKRLEKEAQERLRQQNRIAAGLRDADDASRDADDDLADRMAAAAAASGSARPAGAAGAAGAPQLTRQERRVVEFERQMLRYLMKYGMLDFCLGVDEQGREVPLCLVDAVSQELEADEMRFSLPELQHVYEAVIEASRTGREEALAEAQQRIALAQQAKLQEETERLHQTATGDMDLLKANEIALAEKLRQEEEALLHDFRLHYLERKLMSAADDVVRRVANELVPDKYVLSKVHTKYANVERDEDRLQEIVPRTLAEWRDSILAIRLDALRRQLGTATAEQAPALMKEMAEVMELRKEFAKYMGERVVTPR